MLSFKHFTTHLRHVFFEKYVNRTTVILLVAFIITISWIWGGISSMQRNYGLQRELDTKNQLQEVSRLQIQNLQFLQIYYKSAEYQDLAARQQFGLASSGEKLLILPPNSQKAITADAESIAERQVKKAVAQKASNISQWWSFLFGGPPRQDSGN